MTSAETAAARDAGALDPENPWKGLAAFRETDRRFFFGRDAETEELHRLILRQRSTVLFGLSGLGKTSLLRAGLFPRVREEGFLPIYVRLDHVDSSRSLADQVKEQIARTATLSDVEVPLSRDGDTLWEIFHRHDADFWSRRNRPVIPLLVFDQFEEIFTVGRHGPERVARSAAFLEQLGDLIEGRPPAIVRSRLEGSPGEALRFAFGRHAYKVLVALREDFVPELDDLVARIPSLLQNRMRLQRIDGTQAMEVVLGAGSALVSSSVAEKIVRFVGATGGDEGEMAERPASAAPEAEQRDLRDLELEPALLSVICRELNNRRLERGAAAITADLLAGNRTEILTGFYERSFDGLPASVREFVEEHLLTVSGFRDSVALENVLFDPRVSREAIDQLIERRLVRIDDRSGAERVELAHDVLTGVARASRDATRAERELRAERERAHTERKEALQRDNATRAELRRARRHRTVLLVLVAVAVVALVRAYFGEMRALTSAASEKRAKVAVAAYYELEANLRRPFTGRNADEALAYLAAAIRSNPESVALRSLLLDVLLHLPQPIPLAMLQDELHPVGEGGAGAPPILAVRFSRDGKRVVTVSSDETARTWDVRTGNLIGQPVRRRADAQPPRSPQHSSTTVFAVGPGANGPGWGSTCDAAGRCRPVAPLAVLSRDGTHVVTASSQHVHVWDTRTGESVELQLVHGDDPGRPLGVTAVAFSPDGERLVTGSPSGDAQIWNARTGAPIGDPMDHIPENQRVDGQWIGAVAFSPDGERVATASTSNVATADGDTARLWDARTGASIGVPMKHAGAIGALVFSSDGERLVTGSDDHTARLWDGRSGAPLGEPMNHDSFVAVAAFSPDGATVVTGSIDMTARLWDGRSGAPVGPPMKHDNAVVAVAFSPDGTRVMTGSSDRTVRLWDARAGATVWQTMKQDGQVTSVAFSPDGQHAAASTDVGAASLWSARVQPPIAVAMKHDRKVMSVASSPDGKRVLTTTSNGVARLWDARSGAPIGRPMKHERAITAAAFSPDGARVVTASIDKTARLWNGRSGAPIGQPMQHHGAVAAVAFSSDGQRIVTGSSDRTARLWDGRSGAPIGRPMQHPNRVLAVSFQPGGDRVVTVSAKVLRPIYGRPSLPRGDTARLWDGHSGDPIGYEQNYDSDRAQAFFFSPDGEQVFTASRSGQRRAMLWRYSFDTENGPHSYVVGTFFTDDVIAAAFSPDGERLVTASADHTARLWSVRDGVPIGRPMRHDAAVRAVAFSPDGERVVTGSSDRTARIWDGRSGALVAEPLRHDRAVRSVAFSGDGESVVTGSGHTVRVWAAPSGTPADAEYIALLAEALTDLKISAEGAPVPDNHRRDPFKPPQAQGIGAIRAWLADRSIAETSGRAEIRWLLADPATRTVSPVATITAADHARSGPGERVPQARTHLEKLPAPTH